MPSNFPIEIGLKQGDALSPLLINFPLEYAIRKVRKNNFGLDMNGSHHMLIYADDVNLIDDDISAIDVLLNVCKGICLALNTRKSKYIEVEHHRSHFSDHEASEIFRVNVVTVIEISRYFKII